MSKRPLVLVWLGRVLGGLLLGLPIVLAAQTPGVNGTIATEGTVQKTYEAANTVIVKTIDGVEHVFHFTKDTLVHGGKEGLRGLNEGSTVVVHYTVEGTTESAQEIDRLGKEGLKSTEGVVTTVDRKAKTITVKFTNGTQEVFRLTDSAVSDSGKDIAEKATEPAKVIVYYTDEAGHKVAHFFKRIS